MIHVPGHTVIDSQFTLGEKFVLRDDFVVEEDTTQKLQNRSIDGTLCSTTERLLSDEIDDTTSAKFTRRPVRPVAVGEDFFDPALFDEWTRTDLMKVNTHGHERVHIECSVATRTIERRSVRVVQFDERRSGRLDDHERRRFFGNEVVEQKNGEDEQPDENVQACCLSLDTQCCRR